MPFKFRGETIPGILLRHGEPPPMLQVYRTHFPGVYGESQIVGGIGGRPLEFPFLLHNTFSSRKALEEYIEVLNTQKLGTVGKIEYTTDTQQVPPYEECTFHGFAKAPDGPLEDVADTLDGGWFCYGVLLFYQLRL